MITNENQEQITAADGLNGTWSVRRLECGAAPRSLKPTCKARSGGDRSGLQHLGNYLHCATRKEERWWGAGKTRKERGQKYRTKSNDEEKKSERWTRNKKENKRNRRKGERNIQEARSRGKGAVDRRKWSGEENRRISSEVGGCKSHGEDEDRDYYDRMWFLLTRWEFDITR